MATWTHGLRRHDDALAALCENHRGGFSTVLSHFHRAAKAGTCLRSPRLPDFVSALQASDCFRFVQPGPLARAITLRAFSPLPHPWRRLQALSRDLGVLLAIARAGFQRIVLLDE